MTFTPELARRQFSALSQLIDGKPAIFFDGPGGAQVSRSVLEKMTDYLGAYNANLGGHYFSSRVTGEVMGQARAPMSDTPRCGATSPACFLCSNPVPNRLFGSDTRQPHSVTFAPGQSKSGKEATIGKQLARRPLRHDRREEKWRHKAPNHAAMPGLLFT